MYKIRGLDYTVSPVYHGRLECIFYGARGRLIKQWIRDTFGDSDDFVYASDESEDSYFMAYESLITEEQLLLVAMRWS